MRINLKQNFLQVSFICPVYVWNFRHLKRIDFKSTWCYLICSVRPTYHRVVVYLIIVSSLQPFTGKDLLQYFGKCKQVFFLLIVIVMDSIKSNLSVNFVEGIQ